MTKRTAIVWIDGERYVLRGHQVDKMLELGVAARSTDEAWEMLRKYAEQIDA